MEVFMNKLFLLISLAALVSEMPVFSMNQENRKRNRDEQEEDEINKKQKFFLNDDEEEELEKMLSGDIEKQLSIRSNNNNSENNFDVDAWILSLDAMTNDEFLEFVTSFPEELPDASENNVNGLTQALRRLQLRSATSDDIELLKNVMKNLRFQ